MKKDSIKTLVLSDSPISHVKGYWCFNFLQDNIKLGSIVPKHLVSEMKFLSILKKYLRTYILTILFSKDWDVVISTSFADGLGFAIIQLLGFRRKVKHLLIDQASLSINKFLHPILPIVMNKVSKIICYTSKQANWWNDNLGANKAIFIPYAIVDRGNMLGIGEKKYVFSGGASSRDYLTLVKAAEQLEISFIIIAVKDPVTRKTSLEKVVPLPDNVTVYPLLPRDTFLRFIKESSIVVIPLANTVRAGGQSVLLEAFAAGKPVIATRTAGMEDYVEDGKTGILVSPFDSEELRQAITKLLTNKKLRKFLGQNARKEFETTYNIKKIGKKVTKVIVDLL